MKNSMSFEEVANQLKLIGVELKKGLPKNKSFSIISKKIYNK